MRLMMLKYENFNQLVDHICLEQNLGALRPVIEKELLHYDILFILAQKGCLKNLTFRGGTALRLCYNLQRFSEDLDFVGGPDFSAKDLHELQGIIEDYIGQRYQLSVELKEPKEKDSASVQKVRVMKWQLSIVTRPESRDLPKQRVKIEVANIPAYTRKLMPITVNHDFLPEGYTNTFVYVESLEEILADKVVACAARNDLKARDVWDLQWLLKKRLNFNIELVHNKITDYAIQDFSELLRTRIAQLQPFVYSDVFLGEMGRFLDDKTVAATLAKEGFLEYVIEQLTVFLNEVVEEV